MRRLVLAVVFAGWSYAACAAVQAPPAADKTPMKAAAPSAPASAAPAPGPDAAGDFKPVAWGKLVVKLPVGTPYAVTQSGMFCAVARTQTWAGGQNAYNIPGAKEAFHDEFVKAGLQVEGDTNNLFETNTPQADFVIAGIVTEYHSRVCTPNFRGDAAVMQKGDIHMTIEWQLYSRLQKQLVATARTSADDEITEPVSGGGNVMVNGVFIKSLGQLAQAPEIRNALSGKPRGEDELVKPTSQTAIPLPGALAATPRGVEAETSSVVLVRTGGGYGSGFLVSSDGYILTAAHVVGDATTVKIRWSDKKETDGVVVRLSKGRDVALIKTDPRGRAPLPLRLDPPAPGETVFVVGAPWEQELQSTITRGVLSANRVKGGYAFIQSDVAVGFGASGGPLLDEKGRILGLTDTRGTLAFGAATGINFFVPVTDALKFISVEPK